MKSFLWVIVLLALAWFLWPTITSSFAPAPSIAIPGSYSPTEWWACRAPVFFGDPGEDLVKIDGDLRTNVGRVALLNSPAGPQPAHFSMDGLHRRWDWCPETGGAYMCAFVIDVEGDGRYYKFSQDEPKSNPSGAFECRQTEVRASNQLTLLTFEGVMH